MCFANKDPFIPLIAYGCVGYIILGHAVVGYFCGKRTVVYLGSLGVFSPFLLPCAFSSLTAQEDRAFFILFFFLTLLIYGYTVFDLSTLLKVSSEERQNVLLDSIAFFQDLLYVFYKIATTNTRVRYY